MKQSKEKFYKSHKLRTHLLALLCFLSIFIPVTFIVFNQYNFDNECGQNFVSVGPSAIGGDFTLTNTQNQKQNSESIIFKPSLIYFGYSFCPDICPFDLQRNVTAVDILKEQNISSKREASLKKSSTL